MNNNFYDSNGHREYFATQVIEYFFTEQHSKNIIYKMII